MLSSGYRSRRSDPSLCTQLMAGSIVTVLEKAVITDDLNSYECPIRMPEAHCQHGGHPTQINKKKAQD